MLKCLFVLVLFLFATVISGAEQQRLTGFYQFGGKTLYDPPANEPKNTHLYIELTDSAAKDLYQRLDVKAVRDECADDGSYTKNSGAIQCTRGPDGKQYRCWLGVDLKRQSLVGAVNC